MLDFIQTIINGSPLTVEDKKALHKDRLNRFKETFDCVSRLDEVSKDMVFDGLHKELKVKISSINAEYKNYKTMRAVEKKKEINKETAVIYNKMFKEIEEVEFPYGYSLNNQYLTYESKDGESIPLCRLFNITSKIIADDRAYFKIKKIENGKKREMTPSARDFIDSKRVATHFADRGEVFDTQKANLVTKFISEYIRINEDKMEVKKGKTCTGWNDNNFYLPSLNNDCVWLDTHGQLEERFKTKGTLESQISMLKELSKGKAFLLSLAGLTSSLYGVIDQLKLNFTVHIGGITGEGKSFAVKTAVSLYGVPSIEAYGKNWNATLNGLETYWENMKYVPMWCDEMESAKNLEEVRGAIYIFAEGTGKSRAFATRDGDIFERDIKTFKGILFTTGEKNINDIMTKSKEGDNQKLGLTRRTLDFKVADLWGGIDMQKVGKLLDKNYGVFVKSWIEYINQNRDTLKNTFDLYEEELNIKQLNGKENLIYAMLTTLDSLQNMKVLSEAEYERQKESILILASEEIERMEATKNISGNFLDSFRSYIAQHHNSFLGSHTEDRPPNVILGEIRENDTCILPTVFKQFCHDNGFIEGQVLTALRDKDLIDMDIHKKTGEFKSFYKSIFRNKKAIRHLILKNPIEIIYYDKKGNEEDEDIPF